MEWLPDGENFLKMCLFVSTESRNVTDRRTPHDGIGRACIASHSKKHWKFYLKTVQYDDILKSSYQQRAINIAGKLKSIIPVRYGHLVSVTVISRLTDTCTSSDHLAIMYMSLTMCFLKHPKSRGHQQYTAPSKKWGDPGPLGAPGSDAYTGVE